MQTQSNYQPGQSSTRYTQRAFGTSREFVGEHAFSSTLLAFGVGFGVGVAVGSALVESMQPQRGISERLGHQMIEAMSRVVPDALSTRMHR